MTMICQGCGNEVAGQYRFCPGCGGRSFGMARPGVPQASGAPNPQPVSSQGFNPAQAHYAGFWRRTAAALIDGLVLLLPSYLLVAALAAAGMSKAAMTVHLALILAQWLYFAGMESSERQGTLGKRAMGMWVCDMNGERISFGVASGRYFGKLLSSLLLCLGYLMVAFTERKQGLHDKMAGTVVLY